MIPCYGRTTLKTGEAENLRVDLTPALEVEERITGTPTAASVPAGLTITNVQTNAAPVEINGNMVEPGKALLCTVAKNGSPTPGTYEVEFTLATNATAPRTQKTEGVKVIVK